MKRWKTATTTLLIVLLIAGLFLAFSAYNATRQEQKKLLQTQQARKNQQENTITAKAQKALSSTLSRTYNLELSYDKSAKTMTIVDLEENPSRGLDSPIITTTITDILRRGYFLFVYGGQIVFALEGVEKIALVQKMPMVTEGIEPINHRLKITSAKDRFLSVNWKELEGKSIHPQIQKIAEVYFVHPQLAKI